MALHRAGPTGPALSAPGPRPRGGHVDRPISLSTSGPPETVLIRSRPPPCRACAARELPEGEARAAIAAVVARFPRFLDGWARLGQLGRDDMEQYAAFRVGYHRGLDRLRAERLAGERLRALVARGEPRASCAPSTG